MVSFSLIFLGVCLIGAGVWLYNDLRASGRTYRLFADSVRYFCAVIALMVIGGFFKLIYSIYQHFGFAAASVAFVIPAGWAALKYLDFAADGVQRVVRGTRISVAPRRKSDTPERLYVGDVEIPASAEATSFLAVASPGAGKTQSIMRMLDSMIYRGDVVVCVDPGGEMMRGFFRDGDTIFNPLDIRTVSWSPFAEMTNSWDALTLAASIVGGTDGDGEKADWNQKVCSLLQL